MSRRHAGARSHSRQPRPLIALSARGAWREVRAVRLCLSPFCLREACSCETCGALGPPVLPRSALRVKGALSRVWDVGRELLAYGA